MLVIVAAALLVMVVVVMMLVIVAAALAVVVVVVMMLVIVAAALPVVIVVVVMLVIVAAALLVMVVVVVMLMIVAAALLVVIVVVMMVMMMMLGFLRQAGHFCLQGIGALHGLQELGARQIVPGGGDDDGGGVMLAEERDGGLDLGGGGSVGVGQDDATGVLHLVVEEFTEVLHVHLALACVHHGGEAAKDGAFGGGTLYGADHVGELAHARGLDEDTVGRVLGQHLRQSLTEVANQGAADAARVHLVDLDACLGQKAAVDADLAELVLNEDELLACVGLSDELLDEGGLTGAQKAGENVDLGHDDSLLYEQIIFGWESKKLHLVLYPFSG